MEVGGCFFFCEIVTFHQGFLLCDTYIKKKKSVPVYGPLVSVNINRSDNLASNYGVSPPAVNRYQTETSIPSSKANILPAFRLPRSQLSKKQSWPPLGSPSLPPFSLCSLSRLSCAHFISTHNSSHYSPSSWTSNTAFS